MCFVTLVFLCVCAVGYPALIGLSSLGGSKIQVILCHCPLCSPVFVVNVRLI